MLLARPVIVYLRTPVSSTLAVSILAMQFPEALGVISCRCVLHDGKPILAASHAGGDWQMYCSWDAHDFNDDAALKAELLLVHIEHLVAADQSLLQLADLPNDMGAARVTRDQPWKRYEDKDD